MACNTTLSSGCFTLSTRCSATTFQSLDHTRRTRVIFVVEALLIYLDAAAAERLLDACRGAPCAAVSLCFADRLAIDGVDEAAAARLFAARGFDLVRYLPKPGLARHMGVALRRES